ncbi:RNA ligase RtcB family protein [Desulfogranum japonicum]|uniref:RNA ligase RtcB family protein n=1 Tax=Desulfogranum japonicum TaxID=231447 RepID=UPI00048C24E2|nr:RNA ligase RtcB family protein [Desulfogranum japonicum]
MTTTRENNCKIQLIADESSAVDGEAMAQLRKTSSLPGMQVVVGLPDLHPGRGYPVGVACLSRGFIYPQIIGSDIGCGIGLWGLECIAANVKQSKWVKRLQSMHHHCHDNSSLSHEGRDEQHNNTDVLLGTIGSGNHFAEIQRVESVHCPERFRALGLQREQALLLVHSGSRGMGDVLLRKHQQVYGIHGVQEGTTDCTDYLSLHDACVQWAKRNRSVLAERIAERLHVKSYPVIDIVHNCVEQLDMGSYTGWLHRKGAATSSNGPIVIPGTRGTYSYLVEPIGEQRRNLFSLAHGAGRKWNRKSCKERLYKRYSADSLRRTAMGSIVICDDRALLYEEAPQAYKDIEAVIKTLEKQGLIQIIAVLKPYITLKQSL